MRGRVEHYPDILLRLVAGQAGTSLNGPGDSRIEILDSDVQMRRDVLLACLARPDRRRVLGFVLEVQPWAYLVVRRRNCAQPSSGGSPAVPVPPRRPASQAGVRRRLRVYADQAR